jgi:hypothetical protein
MYRRYILHGPGKCTGVQHRVSPVAMQQHHHPPNSTSRPAIKNTLCTSDPILEKAQNIFHTNDKKRVVLMEYTTLMKGQSCISLN